MKQVTPPMNPEIKAQWLAALRSGNYQQGIGQLYEKKFGRDYAQYCCLGVLADVIKDEENTERSTFAMSENNVLTAGMSIHSGLSRSPYVPISVVSKHMTDEERKCALLDRHPEEGDSVELWMLNDRYKLSFPELANIIEEAL